MSHRKLARALIATTAATLCVPTCYSVPSKADGRNLVVAPIISADPGFGNALGLTSMYFFKPSEGDKVSPKSMVGAVGSYSDTDSYVIALFNVMHLKEDRFRTILAANQMKVNNEFDDPRGGEARFSTDQNFVYGRFLTVIAPRTYIGLHSVFRSSEYHPKDASSAEYLALVEAEDTDSGGLGLVVSYDSKNHQRYPSSGSTVELSTMSMLEEFGSDDPYENVRLEADHFWEIAPRNILAMRATGGFASSDVTYSGKQRLGGRKNIRGYVAGEQVAANLISATAEYRWQTTGRFGMVAFTEVAALYDDKIDDIDGQSTFFSGGMGFRYMLSTENKMNFRFDYAVGEGDNDGFYVGMGESF